MRIDSARYEGGCLILQSDSLDAKKFAYKFKAGEYDIKKHTEKRSLDANAYCWVLCSKIASVVGITKEEVYQRAIQEGNQFCISTLLDKDYDSFVRAWTSRGIGWRVQLVDDLAGVKTVFAYYGSSAYDTKAMSALIENLVDEAKNLGVEVRPDDEVQAMLEAWNEQEN